MQSATFVHYLLSIMLFVIPYYWVVKSIAKKLNIERLWFYVLAFFISLPLLKNLGNFLIDFKGFVGLIGDATYSFATGLLFFLLFYGLPLGAAAIISLVQHIKGN